MTARSIRRATERKAKKTARKAELRQANQTLHSAESTAAPEPLLKGPESQPVPASPMLPGEASETPQPEMAASDTARSTSQARMNANRPMPVSQPVQKVPREKRPLPKTG